MKRYRVSLCFGVTYIVEAENEDEAEEKALDLFNYDLASGNHDFLETPDITVEEDK